MTPTTDTLAPPMPQCRGWGRERMGTVSHGQAELLSPLRNFEFVPGVEGQVGQTCRHSMSKSCPSSCLFSPK